MKPNDDLLVTDVVTSRRKRTKSEDKLSMTRELKFKELQDRIDEEESEKIIEEAIKQTKMKDSESSISSELEQEIDALLESETKKSRKKKVSSKQEDEEPIKEVKVKTKKKVKTREVNDTDGVVINKITPDDDIYLTTSFQPLKKRFRLKKVFKVILRMIFVLLVLGAFSIFVVLPIIKMLNDSKPKVIYNVSINYIRDTLNEFVDRVYLEKDGSYMLNSKLLINTNMDDYKNLNDKNLLLNTGFDFKNDIYDLGMYISDSNNLKYGFNLIEKDDESYYNLTTSENFIKNALDYSNLDSYIDNLDKVNVLTRSEYKYYIDKIASVLKNSINDDDLVATKEEIDVDGVSTSVVRNSFKLNKDKLEKLENDMSKLFLKDKKYLEIEAKLLGVSLDEVKEKYGVLTEYDKDYILTFNIYTINGNEFAGFDIEENGFRNIYYYTIKNKFEFHLNIAADETCRKAGNCTAKDMVVIDLIGTTKDDVTTIELYYNTSDIGSLKVKELTEERISLDYKLVYEDTVYGGAFILGYDSKKEEYLGALSYESVDKYIDLNFVVSYDNKATIGKINSDKVVIYNKEEMDSDRAILNEKLTEVELLDAYNSYEIIFKKLFIIKEELEETI